MYALNLCVNILKDTDGSTHTHTHISLSHTPIPSLSVLLTAPCQALKLDLLVAW